MMKMTTISTIPLTAGIRMLRERSVPPLEAT